MGGSTVFPHNYSYREAIHVWLSFHVIFTIKSGNILGAFVTLTGTNKEKMCLTYLVLRREFMGNICHCRAYIILTSNKLHMDVHQWIERTLLTEKILV